MKLAQGPHHFHEKESQREQYWRRDYSVEVRDTNRDGTKEIVVQFNHIQRIMIYKGLGEWERL
jgi:ribosomal protein L21E